MRPTQGELDAWPNCVTSDCEYKACANQNSIYCTPCTFRLNASDSAPTRYFNAFRAAQHLAKTTITCYQLERLLGFG
jgi:hypothetical protein